MQSTRQEILSILREEKQATVDDLADRLELTPMTIRHHLNVLQAQNLVMASKVRRSKKVGRPRLVYTLTDAADELFPSGYGELARRLVGEVKETMGVEETRALFRRIAADLASEAPPPEKGQSFEDRLDQVSDFLKEQGFLSRWEKTEEGYVLTNINCPYRRISREHGEVCILDTELLERLLDVEPQRRESMRTGDRACIYLLKPNES
ncbi:MAG: helix-turn-helix transcriptional regulator [Anaerolineae bacterium]|jgi:predicted ArsR family transcriptional regulator